MDPARLASARSKVGTEGLMDEIVLDVMIDLADAFPAAMAGLDRADELRLQQAITEKTRETHLGRYV